MEEKEEDSGGEGTRMMVTMMIGMVMRKMKMKMTAMEMRKVKPGSPR